MEKPGNLRIMGESAVSGGQYQKVSVMGVLTLTEDLGAETASVMGTLHSAADLSCGKIKIMGKAGCKKLTVRGYGSVMGTLTAEEIHAEGLGIMGQVDCGSIACTKLKVRGVIRTEGLLSADTAEFRTKWQSTVGEMGGRSVLVRGRPYARTLLKVRSLEFDEVDIECVQAGMVRGVNVRIGKGCEIGTVEYSGTLFCHPGARVGTQIKV